MKRVATGLGLALLLWACPSAQAGEPSAAALLDRLEAVWKTRSPEAYVALWSGTAEVVAAERDFASDQFAAGESQLVLLRPTAQPVATTPLQVGARIVGIREPRGSVVEWSFRLEPGAAGWTLTARQPRGRLDGLIHLSLDPAGYRADGMTLQLEDFSLEWTRGTLFMSPPSLGPTLLVFVGEGKIRITPRPDVERDQLRQFCGKPELLDSVKTAFIRIHPAAVQRVLAPYRLDRDPESQHRWSAAQKMFAEHETEAFILDASVPGAPWGLVPPLNDALVVFETDRFGVLSFAVNTGDPEGIGLFDRSRRKQICLYPAAGGTTDYDEDADRAVDVVSHDLHVRFDPGQESVSGEDTLRLRLSGGGTSARLRLHGAFAVTSVSTPEDGQLLFFRVRHQNSLMIALGPLSGRAGDVSLTVRYAGRFSPEPMDRELLQQLPPLDSEEVRLETARVYSNRDAWYPQTGGDDHAEARMVLDVPEGYFPLTGGREVSNRTTGGRTVVEYRTERPGKYLTVAVGRFVKLGEDHGSGVSVTAFSVPRTRAAASEALSRSADILRFYASEFGPCPFPSVRLGIIEARTPGGHSPPGMVLLSQRPALLRSGLRDDPAQITNVPGFFLAHELAHQWWGQGVAGKNYHDRWLSEGLAQYAAALWVRHAAGEEAFRSLLRRLNYWAKRGSGEGPISLGYRLGHIKDDPQAYRSVVYDKAAYVLHMLRGVVGEDAFRQALTRFQDAHRYGKAGTADLREALESASGIDLRPYFQAWIHGTALPSLQASERREQAGSGYRTRVEVQARDLPGPVPLGVTVVHDGGRKSSRITLAPQGTTVTVETPSRPRKVELNDDYGLLANVDKQADTN